MLYTEKPAAVAIPALVVGPADLVENSQAPVRKSLDNGAGLRYTATNAWKQPGDDGCGACHETGDR